MEESNSAARRETEIMKTKFLCVALLGSAAVTVQANPGVVRGGGGGFRGGAVAHAAPAAHAPARASGVSSFHSMPVRNFGSRSMPARNFGGGINYSRQRSASFGMRSYRPTGFRQPSIYRNRATFTRSGPYTAATIRQPNQSNRFPRFANHRNPAATTVWNQRNTRTNFRNGNNLRNANNFRNGNHRLRGDWQKHVFARQSGDWHRDWDRNCDHWWNGHQCSFVNGSWVIFSFGYDPWWPWAWTPPDYFAYGSPYSGYNYPSNGYDDPYSYNYDPGYDNSGDYQDQMYYDQNSYPDQNSYYDQNSYPDQSQGYYDSSVYQTQAYYDPNTDSDQSQSNYSSVVAAQERLAREGYYNGESNGAFGPEMRQALRQYQRSHDLRITGYLDKDTVAAMGLR
jgi:hypothetical protein